MITTVTLNPSIDIRYFIDEFNIGSMSRVSNYSKSAGGKGLNVSRVLKQLDEQVRATGFIGGYQGKLVKDTLIDLGINSDFIEINGETRNCIAIISQTNETEILEPGPYITSHYQEKFLCKYRDIVQRSSIIILSGSLPRGVGSDFYQSLIKIGKENNIRVLLDTSGLPLKQGIKAKPYLVKPNINELEQLYGEKIRDDKDIYFAGKKLLDEGVELVVVSLGHRGSMVFTGDSIYRIKPPMIKAINTVGCGDSMVAGLAYGLNKDKDLEEILRFASAVGTANALETNTGFIKVDRVNKLYKDTLIERIV